MSQTRDWRAVLRAIAPKGKPQILDGMADEMDSLVAELSLTTALRQAHFLAQCAHESDGFRAAEEYASGAAYEGRLRLGNTKPGDGRRFKGRSPIQLTGRANYVDCGRDLGVDLVGHPELAAEFPLAAHVAGWFWRKRPKLNAAADRDDVRAVTKIVNGGYNGLDDRVRYLARAKKALAVPQPDPIVKALQQSLLDLCYFEVGKADGLLGSRTVAAVSAFQHDNELPVSGKFDAETMSLLRDPATPRRKVSDERATTTRKDLLAEGSRIVKQASGQMTVGRVLGLAGGGVTVDGLIANVTEAQSKVGLLKMALGQVVGDVPPWVWGVALLAIAAALFYSGKAIADARVHDERVGKTA